ncbi:uncharacterized protein BO95DRAFT_439245, partial [Aspergillus brunneoviolaceus CBS 621.78]
MSVRPGIDPPSQTHQTSEPTLARGKSSKYDRAKTLLVHQITKRVMKNTKFQYESCTQAHRIKRHKVDWWRSVL